MLGWVSGTRQIFGKQVLPEENGKAYHIATLVVCLMSIIIPLRKAAKLASSLPFTCIRKYDDNDGNGAGG